MRRKQKFTIYLLLILFGLLSLKNLMPAVGHTGHENCAEFGHIHLYKLSKIPSQAIDQKDDDCHEGKSISGFVVFAKPILEMKSPEYANTKFSRVYSVKNNFKSPYLKLRRKPPRFG